MTCASGSFSTTANALSCAPWTECALGDQEVTPGTATSDRVCEPIAWTRQFGTNTAEVANAMSVRDGVIAIVGSTQGTLQGQTPSGSVDAFVRTYDVAGNVLWTRQFGSSALDVAQDVSIDSDGHVVVSGVTQGTLPGQFHAGESDAFVRVYDAAGNLLWTRQFGTTASDNAPAVSVGGPDNIAVAGGTWGTLAGQTSAGGPDAYVRVYNADGVLLRTRQFGTSGQDAATAVSYEGNGFIVVAGETTGSFPGQSLSGNRDAFVRAYDSTGTASWTRQFGSSAADDVTEVSVHVGGYIVVSGLTVGTLPGQSPGGDSDAFIRTYNTAGTEQWTRQFGTSGFDSALAVDVGDAAIVVSGVTGGTLPGQTSAGDMDAFVRIYTLAGSLSRSYQLGTSAYDAIGGVGFDSSGNVIAAGYTYGTLSGQTSAGGSDAFLQRIVPP